MSFLNVVVTPLWRLDDDGSTVISLMQAPRGTANGSTVIGDK